MPFQTAVETKKITNLEIKKEYQEIIGKVSELHEQHRLLGDRSDDLNEVTLKLSSLQQELSCVQKNLKDAEKRYEKISNDIRNSEDKLAKIKEKNDLLTNSLTDNESVNIQLDISIRNKKKSIEMLSKEVEQINKEKQSCQEELIEIQKDLTVKRDQHGVIIGEQSKKFTEISGDISKLNTDINNKKREYDSLVIELKKISSSIEEKNLSMNEFKREQEKIISQAQEQAKIILEEAEKRFKQRETDLQAREGFVSDQEKWQEEKQQKLLLAKAELEKIHNKKIPIQI